MSSEFIAQSTTKKFIHVISLPLKSCVCKLNFTSNPILNELRRQLAKLQQADHSLGSDVLTSLCAQPTRIC